MRRLCWLIPVLLLLSCLGKKETTDALRKVSKPAYTPPGTTWLRDNLFIDETEVTNFSYQEFLYWLRRKNVPLYYLMLPDTACWNHSDIGNADKLISEYLTHPRYRDNPVIGISYRQAQEFCSWRSDRVNELLYIEAHKLKWHPDSNYASRAPKKVTYRLPAKHEWEYAAAAGLDFCYFPMGYEKLTYYNVPVSNTLEYHNYFLRQYRSYEKNCYRLNEVFCPTVKSFSGKANRYGLYQMLGNVSELVSDSLVKGLNFTEPLFSIQRVEDEEGAYTISSQTWNYTLDKKFKKPEPWIGFRCICEVH
jgi:formylglycine-generating enzyme required for sulfatase activity